MNISVNKAHFPVTVLGPGRRIGIWVQGCSIHCKGCVSKDTWDFDPLRSMPVSHLIEWCRKTTRGALDGVTISGGEPFDQPEALSTLLTGLDEWRAADGIDFDILCYSGYRLATLKSRHRGVLERLDAIIPEPYVESLPLTHLWRGSANQQLFLLSDRGREAYRDYLDAPADALGKRIQVAVTGNRVWYIGIPGRGDMSALERSCNESGVKFSNVSWRQ